MNFFMNKFKKLGFVGYNGGLKINPSPISVPRDKREAHLLASPNHPHIAAI